jgi:hypothetical protein
MTPNNKFARMDSIANLIKTILEADTKTKMEELKGKQHKIDKNKNNKIDAHDFAILRGQKKVKEESEQVDEASAPPVFQSSYGLNRNKDAAKKTATVSGKRVKGKGYDNPENERKGAEGNVPATSLMPGHDERAAKFLARQVAGDPKNRKIAGSAQSAKQKEPGVKKEELDPNKSTTDTLKGREKASMNPFLSKKVMMDVPDNVKEETELDEADELNARRQIVLNKTPTGKEREIARNRDELKFKIKTTRQRGGLAGPKPGQLPEELELDEGSGPKAKQRRPYPGDINSPAARAAAKAQHEKMAAADKAKKGEELLDKIKQKNEEVEQIDESDLGSQIDDFMASRNANRKPGQPKMTRRTAQSVIKPGGPKTPEDALKHITQNIPLPRDVGYPKRKMNERELSEPETAEKERIVKGMKKGLAGFKARYGERAKNVMYATATKKAKENK